MLLAARTEDDVSHLEVWVYEEGGEDGEANLYVHHDLLLPGAPPCAPASLHALTTAAQPFRSPSPGWIAHPAPQWAMRAETL